MNRADWIEARVKHRPHLPTLTSPPPSYIVYRRVTPRSSLVYYTYIYTRLYTESGARTNWQSADSERKSIYSPRDW